MNETVRKSQKNKKGVRAMRGDWRSLDVMEQARLRKAATACASLIARTLKRESLKKKK